MPAAFELNHVCPAHLEVPECLRYDYMIHRLSKMMNLPYSQSREMSEYDFWLCLAFENLDAKRREHFMANSEIGK